MPTMAKSDDMDLSKPNRGAETTLKSVGMKQLPAPQALLRDAYSQPGWCGDGPTQPPAAATPSWVARRLRRPPRWRMCNHAADAPDTPARDRRAPAGRHRGRTPRWSADGRQARL